MDVSRQVKIAMMRNWTLHNKTKIYIITDRHEADLSDS